MAVGDGAVVIKRIKKVSGGGHHGGAWKVAYADFVTAMMAFFLLMWLINTTSPEQKRGIADYFAPASVSQTTSGSGGILGGTALGKEGGKADGSMSIIEELAPEAPPHPKDLGQSSDKQGAASTEQADDQAMREAKKAHEEQALQAAAASLRQSIQSMPELAELSKQIIVEVTPEGLRIQLVDQEGRSMFDQGSSKPNPRAQVLLRAVGKIVNQLPNRVTISGHTSMGADGKTNDNDWGLSQGRANEARKILQTTGVATDRIAAVNGKANAEPLYPDDPMLAGNRRIAIVLLREAPVLPPR